MTTFSPVNTLWVLLGAALVFFMQAGFSMCEAGFTRAKNTGNILMKNLMDFCIGTPCFWLVGFGIMFGSGTALFGWIDPLIMKDYSHILPAGVPLWSYAIFQTVFCATSATIVSGAMAERTKFSAYCIYSAAISLFIYPVSGHWIWGGGWLAQLGFHDFAGSTAVHMVGGVCALIGAKILGPRIGKYDKEGKPRAILGHNLTAAALGVFILWFCLYGFNGAAATSVAELSSIFVTTTIAPAVATVVCMIFTWVKYGKPDVSMCLNASLAGLVAITAPCADTDALGATVIGIVSGLLVVFGVWFLDYKLKIDDPVGAVAVHFFNGVWGSIAVGLFATGKGQNGITGLFYGGGFSQLGIQLLGVVTVCAFTAVTMFLTFYILKHTIGLRASREEEIKGLDTTEHGLPSSYADFVIAGDSVYSGSSAEDTAVVTEAAPVEASVPVQHVSKTRAPISDSDVKMTKVDIIANQEKFEVLKHALSSIGITGMTVSHVMGCGMQKGSTEFYRGVPVDARLLPKMKVEIVVCKVPVEKVVEVAKNALYTGKIGDGKIFVYDVENVIKVRTGEEAYEALQDND